MEKKLIIWASVCGCFALFCILVAAILPPVLMSFLNGQIQDSVELTESQHNVWGKVPGSTESIASHIYHFFSIENPDQVLYNGSTPVLTEMNGYVYQEFDDYLNRTYTKANSTKSGDDWMHYFYFQWVDVTDHCIWRNDTSPSDKVTMVNVAAFGVWDQLKRLPPEKVALSALYSLAVGLNNDIEVSIYSQGILSFLNESIAWSDIFEPSGFTSTLVEEIWNDARYGWNNSYTFTVWVNAYRENLDSNGKFKYPSQPIGSLYVLATYFNIMQNQLSSLFKGNFSIEYYPAITEIIENYYCNGNEAMCTGQFLGALQWSNQTITNNPPLGQSSPSIASSNSTVFGYPEMSYFMSSFGLYDKYPDVEWTTDDYISLFGYDLETGWPTGQQGTLLDLGHINYFFSLGRVGNFIEMATYFNLTSSKAQVLWDYVNVLISITALQGNVDQAIFNTGNRGITSELSLGNIASQALYGTLYQELAIVLPLELATRYAYSQILTEGLTCESVVTATAPDLVEVCDKTQLIWENNTAWFGNWVSAYQGGTGSIAWVNFQQIAQITADQMTDLFDPTKKLVKLFIEYDNEIKEHYHCKTNAPRCHDYDLVEMQWGSSGVTMNLPGDMGTVMNLTGLHSVMDWGEPFKSMFAGRPEYGAWVLDRGLGEELLINTTSDLEAVLNFDNLLGGSPLQSLFIMVFLGNYSEIEEQFSIPNGEVMVNYLRYMTDKFAFGGMFITRTVDEWLWTAVDPLLESIQTTNPLLGGDPSTDPTSVRLGANETREEFYERPTKYKHAMNTGKSDINEVRWYRLYNGLPYINYLTKQYLGHNQWGPIIDYVTVNPWAAEMPLAGGDTWNFQPNIGDDSNIVFFLDQNSRIANGSFVQTRTEHGFNIFRYRIGPEMLANVSTMPEYANYYQFGPNGVVNQTSVMGAPFFASKPYFLDGDPVINSLVNYTEPQLNVPSNYESYLDIEEYSGAVFYVTEKIMVTYIQFSAELKPDALYPNLGMSGLQSTGYRTYMPTFFMEKIFAYSDHIVIKYYDPIKMVLHIIKWTQIVGYTVGSLAVVWVGGIFLKAYINKKRRQNGLEPEEGFKEMS